jgi:hypothetical protein
MIHKCGVQGDKILATLRSFFHELGERAIHMEGEADSVSQAGISVRKAGILHACSLEGKLIGKDADETYGPKG